MVKNVIQHHSILGIYFIIVVLLEIQLHYSSWFILDTISGLY